MSKLVAYGITGIIGSGKTFVAQRLVEEYGAAVYNADQRAKYLISSSQELQAQITSLFGREAFTEGGVYNREYVAKRVFRDKVLLTQLEALIHPAVFRDFEEWKEQFTGVSPIVFMESALLPRLAWRDYLQGIIVVSAPRELRIERIKVRDNCTEIQALERIAAQPDEQAYLRCANYLVENSSRFALTPQLVQLIDMITA
ncbi:MAG: dephospho-CoA kinase [Bacteroides sp.]